MEELQYDDSWKDGMTEEEIEQMLDRVGVQDGEFGEIIKAPSATPPGPHKP